MSRMIEYLQLLLPQSWQSLIGDELNQPYMHKLCDYLEQRLESGATIYPQQHDWFAALALTPPDQLQVVILGQDPYHGHNQAHGLAFSVPDGEKRPPSLRNIYKELYRDLDEDPANINNISGNLTTWARQGVLLLNATLTVEEKNAGAHQKQGWETFTDAIIRSISNEHHNIVFMLWGTYAQSKAELIDPARHLILTAVHPSPLSAHRGFIGCSHFSATNAWLEKHGKPAIAWIQNTH